MPTLPFCDEFEEKDSRFSFRLTPILRAKLQTIKDHQTINISQSLRDFIEFSELLTQNAIDPPSFFHEVYLQTEKQIKKNKITIYLSLSDVPVVLTEKENDTQREPEITLLAER